MSPVTPSQVVVAVVFVMAVVVAWSWCVANPDLVNDLVNRIRRDMLGSRLRIYGPQRPRRLAPVAWRVGIVFLLSGITGCLLMVWFGFQTVAGLVGFLLVAVAVSGLLFPFASWLPKRRN